MPLTKLNFPAPEWQRVGEMWFRDLPPVTLEQFIARSGGTMIISSYDGAFHLHDSLGGSNRPFADLGSAQAAGDAIVANRLADQQDSFVLDAGLHPSEWRFACVDSFVWFESKLQQGLRIERHAHSQWVAEIAGKKTCIASSAAEAARLAMRQA